MTEDVRVFDLTAEESGQRLDVYLAQQVPELSRSQVQKLIDDGRVTVKPGKAKSNYKLEGRERIELRIPAPEPLSVKAEDIPIDVVYEDSELIVINKARGMVVHPAVGNQEGTLVNALLEHCDDLSGIGGVIRPGIVHRLDKDTTGVLVVAKTDRAHQDLAKQIKDRIAKRKYLALVHGCIAAEEGLIDAPIGRHPTDRKRMAVVTGHSREARTRFKVLERLGDYTLVECRLDTGRTHQIRVHMTYIGHPVVGDTKYGPRKPHFELEGQALHSAELTFAHPVTGKEMTFSAPLPEDMDRVLRSLLAKRN